MRHFLVSLTVIITAFGLSNPASAERIENPIALFNGLDKITGTITAFETKIGEERRFGGLIVKSEVCFTRPITEQPKTTSFVVVQEVLPDEKTKQIFSGWMFAESPGLNTVEHPIFDVWLTGCKDPNAPPPPVEAEPKPDAALEENKEEEKEEKADEAED